jgi:predicted nucleic acid-binding protein
MTKRPKIFLDADVIFAGSASPSVQGASYVVLLMGEITLLDCITSEQVITEVERNLEDKIPAALPEFRLLVKRCLQVVPDPSAKDVKAYLGQADPKDLAILVAALRENCSYLLTFNTRHYHPTGNHLIIQPPGEFLKAVRSQLSFLSDTEDWTSTGKTS